LYSRPSLLAYLALASAGLGINTAKAPFKRPFHAEPPEFSPKRRLLWSVIPARGRESRLFNVEPKN